MSTTLGSGALTYQVVEGWAKLPEGFLLDDCAGAVVDSKGLIYVFTRGEHPVVVFDRDGNYQTSWGHGVFGGTHGIAIAPDDSIYCTDTQHHVIRKFTPEGELLQTIGGLQGDSADSLSTGPPTWPFLRYRETCLWPTATATHGYTGSARRGT